MKEEFILQSHPRLGLYISWSPLANHHISTYLDPADSVAVHHCALPEICDHQKDLLLSSFFTFE